MSCRHVNSRGYRCFRQVLPMHRGYCRQHAPPVHLPPPVPPSPQPARRGRGGATASGPPVTSVTVTYDAPDNQRRRTSDIGPTPSLEQLIVRVERTRSASPTAESAWSEESDRETPVLGASRHFAGTGCAGDSSDAESGPEGMEPIDYLHNAGVYTVEEAAMLARDKLVRQQALYIQQFSRLQHLLREGRRRYLHELKQERQAEAETKKRQAEAEAQKQQAEVEAQNQQEEVEDKEWQKAAEKEVKPSVQSLEAEGEKNENSAPIQFQAQQKLKAAWRYHRHRGVSAVLRRKAWERRASTQPPPGPRCIHQEGGVRCTERCLPGSKFCLRHILNDPHQLLFVPCVGRRQISMRHRDAEIARNRRRMARAAAAGDKASRLGKRHVKGRTKMRGHQGGRRIRPPAKAGVFTTPPVARSSTSVENKVASSTTKASEVVTLESSHQVSDTVKHMGKKTVEPGKTHTKVADSTPTSVPPRRVTATRAAALKSKETVARAIAALRSKDTAASVSLYDYTDSSAATKLRRRPGKAANQKTKQEKDILPNATADVNESETPKEATAQNTATPHDTSQISKTNTMRSRSGKRKRTASSRSNPLTPVTQVVPVEPSNTTVAPTLKSKRRKLSLQSKESIVSVEAPEVKDLQMGSCSKKRKGITSNVTAMSGPYRPGGVKRRRSSTKLEDVVPGSSITNNTDVVPGVSTDKNIESKASVSSVVRSKLRTKRGVVLGLSGKKRKVAMRMSSIKRVKYSETASLKTKNSHTLIAQSTVCKEEYLEFSSSVKTVEDTPVEDQPTENIPAKDTPAEDKSLKHRSSRHKSSRHRSSSHRLSKHNSSTHRSSRHRSSRHRSLKHRPGKDMPANGTLAEDRPVQDVKAENRPAKDMQTNVGPERDTQSEGRPVEGSHKRHKWKPNKTPQSNDCGTSILEDKLTRDTTSSDKCVSFENRSRAKFSKASGSRDKDQQSETNDSRVKFKGRRSLRLRVKGNMHRISVSEAKTEVVGSSTSKDTDSGCHKSVVAGGHEAMALKDVDKVRTIPVSRLKRKMYVTRASVFKKEEVASGDRNETTGSSAKVPQPKMPSSSVLERRKMRFYKASTKSSAVMSVEIAPNTVSSDSVSDVSNVVETEQSLRVLAAITAPDTPSLAAALKFDDIKTLLSDLNTKDEAVLKLFVNYRCLPSSMLSLSNEAKCGEFETAEAENVGIIEAESELVKALTEPKSSASPTDVPRSDDTANILQCPVNADDNEKNISVQSMDTAEISAKAEISVVEAVLPGSKSVITPEISTCSNTYQTTESLSTVITEPAVNAKDITLTPAPTDTHSTEMPSSSTPLNSCREPPIETPERANITEQSFSSLVREVLVKANTHRYKDGPAVEAMLKTELVETMLKAEKSGNRAVLFQCFRHKDAPAAVAAINIMEAAERLRAFTSNKLDLKTMLYKYKEAEVRAGICSTVVNMAEALKVREIVSKALTDWAQAKNTKEEVEIALAIKDKALEAIVKVAKQEALQSRIELFDIPTSTPQTITSGAAAPISNQTTSRAASSSPKPTIDRLPTSCPRHTKCRRVRSKSKHSKPMHSKRKIKIHRCRHKKLRVTHSTSQHTASTSHHGKLRCTSSHHTVHRGMKLKHRNSNKRFSAASRLTAATARLSCREPVLCVYESDMRCPWHTLELAEKVPRVKQEMDNQKYTVKKEIKEEPGLNPLSTFGSCGKMIKLEGDEPTTSVIVKTEPNEDLADGDDRASIAESTNNMDHSTESTLSATSPRAEDLDEDGRYLDLDMHLGMDTGVDLAEVVLQPPLLADGADDAALVAVAQGVAMVGAQEEVAIAQQRIEELRFGASPHSEGAVSAPEQDEMQAVPRHRKGRL